MDFGKLSNKNPEKKIHPVEIYKDLDRKAEAGPLRDVQEEILNNWFENYQSERDVVLKLHTGQGKTLIGLLILQSILNQGKGPSIYICPNMHLVNQTIEQAKKFGIAFCLMDGTDIPSEFLDSKKILICHVQKMFHGYSKFGLNNKSIHAGAIILDDSHACIDAIKEAFTIRIPLSDTSLYPKFIEIFGDSLEKQGQGTFADIILGEFGAILPIPYWDWIDKCSHVTNLLANHKDDDPIKFKWPLLRDSLEYCQAFISGSLVEISPYIPAIEQFGTFHKSGHRILMSATTMDDSFFIKGLDISSSAVDNPLVIKDEKWSGEKMIIIPSLMHDSLTKTSVINAYAMGNTKRNFGTVVLVPSFKHAIPYQQQGCIIAAKNNIDSELEKFKSGSYEKPIVIVNRYDGIDLPDENCRLLIVDSKPYSESLADNYEELCREESNITHIKIAQKIEQGLGRSVRSEKDFSVIILLGKDLINFIRNPRTKEFFSAQTRKQIEIGYVIAEKALDGFDPESTNLMNLMTGIMRQCIVTRDVKWKEYYRERMDEQDGEAPRASIVKVVDIEKKAESLNLRQQHKEACDTLQKFIDHTETSSSEHGWYLQTMARFKYYYDKTESNKLQTTAFRKNRALLKPKDGYIYKPISLINATRLEKIKHYISKFSSYILLHERIHEVEALLSFEETSDHFEAGIMLLGESLGFASQRPDNDDKEGPDNLWALDSNEYLLIECKNEVGDKNDKISKKDVGQMNTNCGWFQQKYPGASFKAVMIIQTIQVSKSTPFNFEVEVLRRNGLKKLRENFIKFYGSLKSYDLTSLTDDVIMKYLHSNDLDKESLTSKYFEKLKIRQD